MPSTAISESTLAQVASKAFENGALQPERLAARADLRGRRAGLEDGQRPAAPVHVLLARRGRRGARARARRAGASSAARLLRSAVFTAPGGSARSRSSARRSRWTTALQRQRRRGRRGVRAGRASAPTDVDVAQLQDTGVGAEVMHLAETGLCEHGEQEAADRRPARPRSAAGCRSTPTAAAWPTASPSAPPDCARSTRSSLQLRGEAGDRQVPGPARSASPMSTAHPASARARC